MSYRPYFSSSDEDGFSDDGDYLEFKAKVKSMHEATVNEKPVGYNDEEEKLQSLSYAICNGKLECVKDLFDSGIDINVKLNGGWTPLLLAASLKNRALVSEFITRGADVKATRGAATVLMLACEYDESSFISVRRPDAEAVTEIVKLLISKDVDAKAVDSRRKTALIHAAHAGLLEVVKLLLPMSDKDAEDNQKWTALFWAVHENHPEVVKFLLEEGLDPEKTDIKGNTVTQIARDKNFTEILQILPHEEPEPDYTMYMNAKSDFEELFEKNDKPQFFSDVAKILYGVRCESLVPMFAKNSVGLHQLLSFSDPELKDVGVAFSFQRYRILSGLSQFHKHAFEPTSMYIVPKEKLFCTLDVANATLTNIKQLAAMEASLKFMSKNCTESAPLSSKEVEGLISHLKAKTARLKAISSILVEQAEEWDAVSKPADCVVRRRNIPWSYVFTSAGLAALAACFCV